MVSKGQRFRTFLLIGDPLRRCTDTVKPYYSNGFAPELRPEHTRAKLTMQICRPVRKLHVAPTLEHTMGLVSENLWLVPWSSGYAISRRCRPSAIPDLNQVLGVPLLCQRLANKKCFMMARYIEIVDRWINAVSERIKRIDNQVIS